MNAFQRIILIILFCGIFLFSPNTVRADEEWKQSHSENFHIIGDVSADKIEEITSSLEHFRRNFFKLFQLENGRSPIPTRILVFKSQNDSDFYLKSSNIRNRKELEENFFQEGQDTNYIIACLNSEQKFDLREIYHHYFHYLLKNYVGKSKIPAWLNEGLALNYEKFHESDDLKASFRNIERKNFELLTQKKLLPSHIFFNTDYYSLNEQEKRREGVFYAEAAVIVSYLNQQGNDEKFRSFLNLISSGNSLNESLIKAFQLDFSTLEKNLKTYAEQKLNENNPVAENQKLKPDDLKFSPITQAETEAFLGDFLYQTNQFDEAELHLLKSLSLNPFGSFAKSTLGLVKLRQYNREEAIQHLSKSLEYKDAGYLSYYRTAFALSREGMTEYGFVSNYEAETAEEIRELLKKSMELNPDFAESYNLFAFVSFVRNEMLEEGLDFIKKALKKAPGNDSYLLRKAELDMRKENFTQARKNAASVYENADNSGLRLYAQNTIQRIDSTEYQLLQSRRREKYPYNDIISEIPFSDEEIARLRAKAMLDSLNAVLRRPAANEKRILGNVVGILCGKNQVDFTVKTENQFIKLRADSFESLNLMTFNNNLTKAEIGCGTLNKDNTAVIIYRKFSDSAPDISGEILSIEFVPKEFTLSEPN